MFFMKRIGDLHILCEEGLNVAMIDNTRDDYVVAPCSNVNLKILLLKFCNISCEIEVAY